MKEGDGVLEIVSLSIGCGANSQAVESVCTSGVSREG